MIHLIFDTNIWIYLANGFNSQTHDYEKETHFEIIAEILRLLNQNKIKIYSNEIIIKEWERNKVSIKKGIEKLNNKLNSIGSIFTDIENIIDKNLGSELNLIKENFKTNLNKRIEKNLNHIGQVEEILYNKCENIKISDSIKIFVTNLASDKKVPFHNGKNNINDALIFFSIGEYFHTSQYKNISDVIFISNNSDDFCKNKESNELHSDLSNYLSVHINFERNLATALKLSSDLIEAIEAYNLYSIYDSTECLFPCKGEEYGFNRVLLERSETLVHHNYIYEDNQRNLFNDLIVEDYISKVNDILLVEIKLGNCRFCNSLHIQCECQNIFCENDFYENLFCCKCGAEYFLNGKDIKVLKTPFIGFVEIATE